MCFGISAKTAPVGPCTSILAGKAGKPKSSSLIIKPQSSIFTELGCICGIVDKRHSWVLSLEHLSWSDQSSNKVSGLHTVFCIFRHSWHPSLQSRLCFSSSFHVEGKQPEDLNLEWALTWSTVSSLLIAYAFSCSQRYQANCPLGLCCNISNTIKKWTASLTAKRKLEGHQAFLISRFPKNLNR